MSFKFQLVNSKLQNALEKSHTFAGGSCFQNLQHEGFCLGKLAGVDWPSCMMNLSVDMQAVMQDIFGEPNWLPSDKMTFRYLFKSNKHKRIYYEIYDYKGFLSCGVGKPFGFSKKATKLLVDSINDELRELISELVIAFNLMRPE